MLYAHEMSELHNTLTLECLEILQDHGILDTEDTDTLRDVWLMATNVRSALVFTRGKRTGQLPQPGRQLIQVAGAAGWEASDSSGSIEHYLHLTCHPSRVVDRAF